MAGFHFSHSTLPSPLNTSDGALKQSGNNGFDDLFMFAKRKITGLEKNKVYTVSIEMEIASDAPNEAAGIGGAPGADVTIKAGASTIEPVKVLNTTDMWYRMNIDKGVQFNDGIDMKIIGNFANGTNSYIYTLKRLRTSVSLRVQSNANGELWVIVGTDSGFEGTTTIFYNSIKVTLK